MSKRSKELMMESVTYLNPSRSHMRIAVKNQAYFTVIERMSFPILMKLVVSITILAIFALVPNDELLSALGLFGTTFQTENHASAERKEGSVISEIGSLAHLNELRDMTDERIHLNRGAIHIRRRRNASSGESTSSVNKKSCGIEPGVQVRLTDVQKQVDEERNKSKATVQEYLNVLKEIKGLDELANDTRTSIEIKLLKYEIKMTDEEGNEKIKLEQQKANQTISDLLKEIEKLNSSTTSFTENERNEMKLNYQLRKNDLDVKQPTSLNNAQQAVSVAISFRDQQKQKYDNCMVVTKNLADKNNNADAMRQYINDNDIARDLMKQCAP